MTMQSVAKLAGVSASTVCRVVHNHSSVAPPTVASVRQAMDQLGFTPKSRRQNGNQDGSSPSPTSIAFLVFGGRGGRAPTGFEELLRGASEAASEAGLSLTFGFVADPVQLPPWIGDGRVGGLLLHGEVPGGPAVRERLGNLPSVWLMADRHRPAWGDQVMTDGALVGELAARYLLGRGCRRLLCLSSGEGSWSFGVRLLAFTRTAREAGAAARVLEGARCESACPDGLAGTARSLVGAAFQGETFDGLFVAEGRLLPAVDGELAARGLGTDFAVRVPVISCNDELPHLLQLGLSTASVDVRARAIGRRGFEHLAWRMKNPDAPERVRAMVEPILVEPGGHGGRRRAPARRRRYGRPAAARIRALVTSSSPSSCSEVLP